MENVNLDGIHGFLFCLFHQGKNENEAFEELGKFNENGFDLNRVIDFFELVRSGKFQLGMKNVEEQPEPTFPLLDMPAHLLQEVVKNLGPKRRHIFRKVCQPLRLFVDDCPLILDKLSILIDDRLLNLSNQAQGLNVSYEIINDGIVMHKSPESAVIRRGNYTEILRHDLQEIFAIPKLTIKNLVIKEMYYEDVETIQYRTMLGVIHQSLINTRNPLKIEKLVINVPRMSEFIEILPHFDARILKEIVVGTEELDEILERNDALMEFEQWTNSRKFRSRLRIQDANFVRNFSHFDFAEVRFGDGFTNEMIMQLIEIYLSRPKFNQMKIDFWKFEKDALDYLMRRTPGAVRRRNSWTFQYPESRNLLVLIVKKDLLWFRGPYFEEEPEDEDMEEVLFDPNLRNDGPEGDPEQQELYANWAIQMLGGIRNPL